MPTIRQLAGEEGEFSIKSRRGLFTAIILPPLSPKHHQPEASTLKASLPAKLTIEQIEIAHKFILIDALYTVARCNFTSGQL